MRSHRTAAVAGPSPDVTNAARRVRVLFLVEGNTDVRFVTGLAEISDLTMMVPGTQYHESGLDKRIEGVGCRVAVEELPGGRISFQLRALKRLLSTSGRYDLILAQEMLRGALSANLASLVTRLPVVSYLATSPVEYFKCKRERRQINLAEAFIGEVTIRMLLIINGKLSTRCIALGPYLLNIASRYCQRPIYGLYYGVDVNRFRPTGSEERVKLRDRLKLPSNRFIIFFPSRVSHEKDPETVIRATALLRSKGIDALLLNLGGGYREFVALARRLRLTDCENWIIGRPAAHPMSEVFEYFLAADVVVQASLAEGLGLSTMEALSCGIPVVATAVGGMNSALQGYASLVPRGSAEEMASELLRIHDHPNEARSQALKGREYVLREWTRERAFTDLSTVLCEVIQRH